MLIINFLKGIKKDQRTVPQKVDTKLSAFFDGQEKVGYNNLTNKLI